MPIYDLFSKRQKRIRGEVPDVYQYDNFPIEFRTQIVKILEDTLGSPDYGPDYNHIGYKSIHDILCREYGTFHLFEPHKWPDTDLHEFILKKANSEEVLDIIELTLNFMEKKHREIEVRYKSKISYVEALQEINARFLEHGIGFQYESGQIIRIDNSFSHTEIIKPVLKMLSDPIYQGANEEFLSAHEHYRHGEYKECLNDCLKSFESVLKIICKTHEWEFKASDTAKILLGVCFDNKLMPDFLQTHFSSLRSSLESGVPTMRNKLSGHGQGHQSIEIPAYMASYMLNLTASSILMLTEAAKQI